MLVSWISQTFLQLVLLSVVIVGVRPAADRRSGAAYEDADAAIHESVKLQEHLRAHDRVLTELVEQLSAVENRLAS